MSKYSFKVTVLMDRVKKVDYPDHRIVIPVWGFWHLNNVKLL